MTEPRWVKLSERKPENNQSCWISTLEKQIFHGHYENHETFGNCFRSPRFALALSFAEYWMPCDMPPLPKEEKLVTKYQKICNQCRPFEIRGTQEMFWDQCAMCYQMANCVFHSSVEREEPKEERFINPDDYIDYINKKFEEEWNKLAIDTKFNIPKEEKPVERKTIKGKNFDVFHIKDIYFLECNLKFHGEMNFEELENVERLVFVERNEEEKPVDPDWEIFDKEFNRTNYDNDEIGDLTACVFAIYRFLGAKYGK